MIAARVSLADLADEDILISGDSLKSWIEACGLTPQDVVEQLKSWLDELQAIPARSAQPDTRKAWCLHTKLARSINKFVAGMPHIHAYLQRNLSAEDFAEIDSDVRYRESVAELRFKNDATLKADLEKRWFESAKALLADLNERGARSAWDGDENLYMRRGALPAAFVS
jgi:citrate synthase